MFSTFWLDLCRMLLLQFIEPSVGFINTPYEVQESAGQQLVTVGVVLGQLYHQVFLSLSTLDNTATGEYSHTIVEFI